MLDIDHADQGGWFTDSPG